MFEFLDKILPSVDAAFSGKAHQLNQRFDKAREGPAGEGLYSHFYTEVKSVYDTYLRGNRQALEQCSFWVPKATYNIITARFKKLGEMLAETQRTGDDYHLLLYVLTICLVDDERLLAKGLDPIGYHAGLVEPLQAVLKDQANLGFKVSITRASTHQKDIIMALQQSIGELEIDNAELKAQLLEAVSSHQSEQAAREERLKANERLIEELKRQAQNTPQQEEVAKARAEARAIFKQRLSKGVSSKVASAEIATSSTSIADGYELSADVMALMTELPPPPSKSSVSIQSPAAKQTFVSENHVDEVLKESDLSDEIKVAFSNSKV